VVYAQLKFLWANGERAHSIDRLRLFADELSRDLISRQERNPSQTTITARMSELSQLLAKCYLKLGQWQYDVEQSWSNGVCLERQIMSSLPDILACRMPGATFSTHISYLRATIRPCTRHGIHGHWPTSM
jgi:hypothetical protein